MQAIIHDIWVEELERSKRNIKVREERLVALPKGSIQKKMIKGHSYYYLFWRDEKKVKSRYLGGNPESSSVREVSEQIAIRKELETSLRRSRLDVALLEKAVRLNPNGRQNRGE